jgi:signal transduction histidine kinase
LNLNTFLARFVVIHKEGHVSLLERKNDLAMRIAVICGVLCFPYYFIFDYFGLSFAKSFVIPTVLIYVLAMGFNALKWHTTSKWLLVLGTSVSLFFYANVLGAGAGAQFLLFALVPLPLLLFNITQLGWILSSVSFPMIAYFLLEFGHYNWLPYVEMVDGSALLMIRSFAVLTTFLLLILSAGAYFLSNRRYELRLEETNQALLSNNMELEESNSRLQTAYEDLQAQQNLLEKTWHDSVYAQLTRTIAHELKNPLFEFGMVIGALEKSLDDRETALMFISSLATTIEELMSLVNAMLESGGASVGEYKAMQVVEVMRRVLILAEGSIKKRNIRLIEEFSDLPMIMGDSKAFLMIFSNLIVNAMEAMSEESEGVGGELVVRLMRDLAPTEGRQGVVIEIADTGVGIPKSRQEGLFKSGQSSKGMEERQRGIGLRLVWKLVDQMGGVITVHSDPDIRRGTMFRIVV